MRVCFFTENFYKGGLDTFLINLFNAWPEKSDDLTLLCNATHPGLDIIEAKVIRPVHIKRYNQDFVSKLAHGQNASKYFSYFAIRAFFVLLQYLILFPWYVLRLTIYFLRSDFDRLMVVNGGYPASLLCRSSMIAWRLSGKHRYGILNFHNSSTLPSKFLGVFEWFIDILVEWSSEKIISVSRNCINSISNRRVFTDATKLDYIYNGIQDPVNSTGIDKNTIGETIDNRYCLLLATYEPRKGHTYLLEAFKDVVNEFPDVLLKIYGDGKDYEKQQVEDVVKRLSMEKNVSLNGFTTDASSLIANATVLVVSSQAYESFGLTIIEAMAYGVPVVTTDVGGIPEVLEGSGAGFVCSRNNHLEFSDAVKRILSDPSLSLKLGKAGRQTFESRFTADKMACDYRRLME